MFSLSFSSTSRDESSTTKDDRPVRCSSRTFLRASSKSPARLRRFLRGLHKFHDGHPPVSFSRRSENGSRTVNSHVVRDFQCVRPRCKRSPRDVRNSLEMASSFSQRVDEIIVANVRPRDYGNVADAIQIGKTELIFLEASSLVFIRQKQRERVHCYIPGNKCVTSHNSAAQCVNAALRRTRFFSFSFIVVCLS